MNRFVVKACALALLLAGAQLSLAPASHAQKSEKSKKAEDAEKAKKAAKAAKPWKGAYFGFNLGEVLGSSDVATTTVAPAGGYFASSSVTDIAPVGAMRLRPRSFSPGLQAGYNLQFHRFVLGVEADFGKMSFNKSSTGHALYTCPGCTFSNYGFWITQSLKTGGVLTVRPRIGYASGGLLIYATGGLVGTHVNSQTNFYDNYLTVNSIYARENGGLAKTALGFTGGGGIERSIGDKLTFKAEYLYAKFNTNTATSTNLATPIIPTTIPPTYQYWPMNVFTHSIAMKAQLVRIGFNYRF